MLIRFSVKNHTSYADESELSFVSSSRKDQPDLRFPSPHVPHGVLPVVGVWGANASGKSNLLKAVEAYRDHVVWSWQGLKPHEPVPWVPWSMSEIAAGSNTEMCADFVLDDGSLVQLGFTIGAGGFIKEWLHRWVSSRLQVIYERDESAAETWYFGPSMQGSKARIAEATRPNSLFISAAAQFNNELLLPIYEKIARSIRSCSPLSLEGYPAFPPGHPMLTEAFRPRLLEILRAADLGVHDVNLVELRDVSMPKEFESVFRPEFIEQLQRREDVHVRIGFVRRDEDGALWELPPERESRGTQVLLSRIADWADTLEQGGLLIVDELDTSLHPDLCSALVALFTDGAVNQRGAQLLFSTHDRGLLSGLRTDEVVLVDKSVKGQSTLRTVSDFRGVRTRVDLRTLHEAGQLGGVPVLQDMKSAFLTGGAISAP